MTRPMDLGHGLFQATNSSLQLRFSATASFTQATTGSISSSTRILRHWKDLQSLWITEAPELELRLVFSVDPAYEAAGPAFATSLEEELCKSKVWADLGFDIILKSRSKPEESIASESHRLAFGLCRTHRPPASVSNERLPETLKNPPEAHAPSDVPTARLASIDIYLQYSSRNSVQQLEVQIAETLNRKNGKLTDLQHAPCSMQYTHSIGKIAVATFALSTMDDLLIPFDQPVDANESSDLVTARQTSERNTVEQLSILFLGLLDFGLQKLILPGVIRNHHIKVVGRNKLQNLSLLAPAVFHPEYQEAMKQRAASLSTISRSLISMLENSKNPVIQSKLSHILEEANDPRNPLLPETVDGNTHENLPTKGLKSRIESSLWGFAQHGLSKTKACKRFTSFFDLNGLPRKPFPQSDDEIMLPESPEQELDPDGEILQLDIDPSLPPNLIHAQVLDELLSDGSSMLTFGDSHEFTQTTEITQTTQTSIENLSQVSEYTHFTWDDDDILMSDRTFMDEGFATDEDFEDMDLG